MNKDQNFTFLWLAVIAAIPLVTQAGCVNSKSVTGEKQNTVETVKNNDPCRQGPITRKSAKENFFTHMYLPKSLSSAQCINICRQEFTKAKKQSVTYNTLVTVERFKASNCKVEKYYPLSAIGDSMRGDISCDVDYTATYSPYTCPRPPTLEIFGRPPQAK